MATAGREAWCEGCGLVLHETHLAGYNVRLGVIEQAICHSCATTYNQDGFYADWHTRTIKRIRTLRRRSRQRTDGWQQTRIEVENG